MLLGLEVVTKLDFIIMFIDHANATFTGFERAAALDIGQFTPNSDKLGKL